jgi:hypothetical protein
MSEIKPRGIAFAKRVGADRQVGEEYLKADRKQKSFMKGRSTQAKVNKPNTAHGKVDMPFTSLRKHAGKREGGEIMKDAKKSGKKPFFLFGKKDDKKEGGKPMKFAKGGGIESRGKTKGKMIKMSKGGRAC